MLLKDESNVENFWENLEQFEGDKCIVMFTSGFIDDNDLKCSRWCPDCVLSEPIVRRLMKEFDWKLLLVNVGTKMFWRDPNHPFRTDSRLMINAIPTLIKWNLKNGRPESVLDGKRMESCKSEHDVEVLVKGFLLQK